MDAPAQRTLMEKWKEHYTNRDFKIKPERASFVGVSFFWGFTLSLMYSTLFVLIPEVAKDDPETAFWLQAIVGVIFVESVMNWFLTARKWVSQATIARVPQAEGNGGSLSDDWRICLTCQMMVPPRSHHCKLCQMCILKRDHHCFFTGSCIGFNNQRRFVVFVFYVAAGSLYGIALLFWYLNDPLPFLKYDTFCTYLPFVALWQWVFGYLTTGLFMLLLQLYLCFVTLIGAGGFVIWELVVIVRGQTSFEAARNIQFYRTNLLYHIRSVFGPFWIVNFIFPLPTSPEGDGVHWPTLTRSKAY